MFLGWNEKAIRHWKTASHIQIIFVPDTWGEYFIVAVKTNTKHGLCRKKSQVPLFRKKMLGIQITEQHPGSSLSLAAIEADLLWGSDLSKLACRFAFWIRWNHTG